MSSTNLINFSLRQNKAIERAIAFDCFAALKPILHLDNGVYVGFGSVWFIDFMLAHSILGVESMISLESDPIVFKRAEFNRPYRTVEVLNGKSSDIIPALLKRSDLAGRPWIVWLDFDKGIGEDSRDELVDLVRTLPQNSILAATFNAHANTYGAPTHRAGRIRELFAEAAPEEMSLEESKDRDRVMKILAKALDDYLISQTIDAGRPGGFVSILRLMYVDRAPMVTVAGVLPSPENENAIRDLVAEPNWEGHLDEVIAAGPLTSAEVRTLQSMLPSKAPLTRAEVQAAGFDLEDEQLQSYVSHYLRYPQFAQIAR
jgi:hypothetical protein